MSRHEASESLVLSMKAELDDTELSEAVKVSTTIPSDEVVDLDWKHPKRILLGVVE
jgi:hypothetical protein